MESNENSYLAPGMTAQPNGLSHDNGSGTASGAASIGPAIREQAGKLAERSKTAGVEAADAVGKAVESAASALQESVPQLAGYVRNAASYTNKLADSLRDRKAEDLIATAVEFGRKQPLMVVAGAAVLGFALARIVKSGAIGAAVAAAPKTDESLA